MTTAFEDLHCEYGWASGNDYRDCAWVARRWRDEYGTTLSDSDYYVCAHNPKADNIKMWGPWPNIMPALWRALPSGRVYVPDAPQGSVHIYDEILDPDPNKIRRVELGFTPEGIWGLDESHIFVWGVRRTADRGFEYPLARFDGNEWQATDAPGFAMTKLHGPSPELIYAAGRGGRMARWDGTKWHQLSMPTDENFSDVFVAAPDEIYATGHRGSLLEGSPSGWNIVTRTLDERLPYACVTKFADQLFVGGGTLGLFRRVGKSDELELFKPKVQASSFENRTGSLLITTPFAICGTYDGEDFQGSAINSVLNSTNTIDIEAP